MRSCELLLVDELPSSKRAREANVGHATMGYDENIEEDKRMRRPRFDSGMTPQ